MTLEQLVLDAPLKLMVKDIRNILKTKSLTYSCKIQYPSNNRVDDDEPLVIQFNQIWIQGWVQSSENNSDSMLISDGTGEVRVTKCTRSPGYNWIKTGSYCGVMATVKIPSELPPEIEAVKFMHISDKTCDAERIWPLEVEDLMNVFRNKITIDL